MSISKKMRFIQSARRARAVKGIARHIDASSVVWLGPSNFWLVRSEHAHASYPGLFFHPPGFSPYMGREERRVQGVDYAPSCCRNWNKRWPNGALGTYADFASTSELPFAERALTHNVSHENDLIFMRINVQVTYIFISIVSHKDLFCHRSKSKLGIGLFIPELAQEAFDLSNASAKTEREIGTGMPRIN